jgi:hypothetical protein
LPLRPGAWCLSGRGWRSQLAPRRVWFSGGGRRGGGGPKDCSTEGAGLQLNVWDDNTRRDIVEDGTTGCVSHTVDAARRVMADPASRKILLASSATTKDPPSRAPSDSGRTTPSSS